MFVQLVVRAQATRSRFSGTDYRDEYVSGGGGVVFLLFPRGASGTSRERSDWNPGGNYGKRAERSQRECKQEHAKR